MIFSSVTFLLLTPAVVVLAALLTSNLGCSQYPQTRRWRVQGANLLLLIFSLLFYRWGVTETVFHRIVFLVIALYLCGMMLKYLTHPVLRKLVLIVGLIGVIGYLSIIKILTYLVSHLGALDSAWSMLVPLGISFIVFHAISYLVEVYRSPDIVTANPIDTGLYLLFFPKLIQGPTVLFHDFAPQLTNRFSTLNSFYEGVYRFVVGLVKKVFVADVLATIMAAHDPFSLDTPSAWIYLLLFTLRLYIDFSGYSDMAIGLCKMTGFEIRENFNFPYISRSITEFWRRWHITLSEFFKRYLYIPLGGSRTGNVYLHIMIIFIISGLWHETGFAYLVWGALHGGCMCVERVLMKRGLYEKIPSFLRWLYTFAVVNVGWIVFMTGSSSKSLDFIALLMGVHESAPITDAEVFLTTKLVVMLIIAVLGSFVWGHSLFKSVAEWMRKTTVGRICMGCVILSAAFLGYLMLVTSASSPFLYFQY